MILAGAAVVLMGSTAMAAGGEGEDKPLKSTAVMKADIYDGLTDLKLKDFKLTDETVDIYFSINTEGNVVVESVEGDNCLVTAYVSQMLVDKKLNVVDELKNVKHHIKVRYVVI